MLHDGDLVELRASVKRWEREFEAKHGRKPTNADAKADGAAWSLYQQYRSAKKRSLSKDNEASKSHHKQISTAEPTETQNLPSTPRKEAGGQAKLGDSDTEEDEEATPITQKVTEVFPTPQFRGRVLGLFDVDLNLLQTPQKPKLNSQTALPVSSSPCPHTPSTSEVVETPQSKRTPEYFQHRISLFPALSNNASQPNETSDVAESPLISRKASRTKPVSEIIREASEIAASNSRSSLILEEHNDASSDEESAEQGPPLLHISSEPDMRDAAPVINPDSGAKNRRSNPKRQTKRVTMRPVDREGALSNAKATNNFVRLKINNKNKKFKRRR